MAAVDTLVKSGAEDVILVVTHGIFSGNALNHINDCPHIKKVFVSNSLPQHEHVLHCKKLEVIDVSELLARAIKIIMTGGSLSALFDVSDRMGMTFDMSKLKYDATLTWGHRVPGAGGGVSGNKRRAMPCLQGSCWGGAETCREDASEVQRCGADAERFYFCCL